MAVAVVVAVAVAVTVAAVYAVAVAAVAKKQQHRMVSHQFQKSTTRKIEAESARGRVGFFVVGEQFFNTNDF